MKILVLLLSVTFFTSISSTDVKERYITRSGIVSFEASTPTFEPITASNEGMTIVIDAASGDIAALALVKGFNFPIALMQEHFNENYIESDQYPKVTLRGNLSGFTYETLKSATSKTVELMGEIELHGIKRPVSIPVDLSIVGESIKLSAKFELHPADFNIDIPKIVEEKISENVIVTVQAVLDRQ